jgi:GT2 family glycosyltransferase
VTIDAVIPNRNGSGLLERCLDALARSEGVGRAVVVDDGSSDGSDARAAELGAEVTRSPGRGFAAAVNHGVALTDTPYVLILNSGAFVDVRTPALLAGALDADERLALCGAGLRDEAGRRAKSHGDTLTLGRAFAIALGAKGRQPPERAGLQDVEFAPLACALARRDAWDALGGLDEGYPFYFEDYDLCWRLERAGWRVAVRWDAGAVHVGGGSSRAADAAAWLPRFQASRMRYLRKRYPRGAGGFAAVWAVNAGAHAALWEARAAVASIRGDTGGARRARGWRSAYLRSAATRWLPSRTRWTDERR